jgi:hypothetical protein
MILAGKSHLGDSVAFLVVGVVAGTVIYLRSLLPDDA